MHPHTAGQGERPDRTVVMDEFTILMLRLGAWASRGPHKALYRSGYIRSCIRYCVVAKTDVGIGLSILRIEGDCTSIARLGGSDCEGAEAERVHDPYRNSY